MIDSKSVVTELFADICESYVGLYFHPQHHTDMIGLCSRGSVQLLMDPTAACVVGSTECCSFGESLSVSSLFELACLGRAQILPFRKPISVRLFLHFHPSLKDSIPTDGEAGFLLVVSFVLNSTEGLCGNLTRTS